MKTMWLIYNGYLNGKKFLELVDWLRVEGLEWGFDFRPIRNSEIRVVMENGRTLLKGDEGELDIPDGVLFWDKDLYLARQLEKKGVLLFNTARAVEICDDKALMAQVLAEKGIQMPKTWIAPKVYGSVSALTYATIEEEFDYPFVVKEVYGSFGEQVYLVEDDQALFELGERLGNTPFIVQEFIESSKGRDVRLNVVGDQVVASMKRTSEKDFRANVTLGGVTSRYEPREEEKALAVDCVKAVGADFAGVDLLFGKKGEMVVCEINSNPHFKSIYECTGVDIVPYMMKEITRIMREEGAE